MRPLKMVLIVFAFVIGLVFLKTIIHMMDLEVIALSSLVTALIGGVTFTISILYAGTLPDYKESEKIPGEIAASLKSLFKDVLIVTGKNEKLAKRMQLHTKEILDVIVDNFKNGTWKQKEINEKIDALDEDILECARLGAQANYISRIRGDLTSVERLSNRVETIKETSFMPAAYTIGRLIVGMVLAMMLFVKIDPYYEGIIITAILGFLLIGLLFLIRDIDDPFEKEHNSFGDVDLEHLFKTQNYLEQKMNVKTKN